MEESRKKWTNALNKINLYRYKILCFRVWLFSHVSVDISIILMFLFIFFILLNILVPIRSIMYAVND